MKLLIVRAQPAAENTAKLVTSAGLTPLVMPLFEIAPIDWTAPDPDQFDGVLITSSNAVRLAGEQLSYFSGLPAFAVGSQTAEKARSNGLQVKIEGAADKAEITKLARLAGAQRLLWLSGAQTTAQTADDDIIAQQIIVYESRRLPASPDFPKLVLSSDAILLHSPRMARHFRSLCDQFGVDPSRISIAALSSNVAIAADEGWHAVAVAKTPNDADLLLAAQSLAR